MARWSVRAIQGSGWLLIVVAIGLPVCAIIIKAAGTDTIPSKLALRPAQVELVGRSAGLAASATAIAFVLSLGPAYVMGAGGAGRSVLTALSLVPLLTPPYIHAYAWSLLFARAGGLGEWLYRTGPGRWLQGEPLAVWVLAGWLWPIFALVIATGWRRTGRMLIQPALLDATRWRAMLRIGLPVLRAPIAAAAAVVFVLGLTEFTIPQLNNVMVYAGDLFGQADGLGVRAGAIVWRSWPLVALIGVAGLVVAAAVRSMRSWGPSEPADPGQGRAFRAGKLGAFFGAGVIGLTVGAPIVVLLCRLQEPGAVVLAAVDFGWHWRDSALIALAVAAGAVLVALASGDGVAGRWVLVGAGVLAVLPAAVVGQSLVESVVDLESIGPLSAPAAAIYDQTPLVQCIGLLGRFAFLAIFLVRTALHHQPTDLVDQARTDGASRLEALALVRWPTAAGAIGTAGLLVGVLALPEVAVSALTRNVRTSWLAMSLYNHMHYGRDDAVIGTCLLMIAPAVAAVMAIQARWVRRDGPA